jgi:hypothetical protein
MASLLLQLLLTWSMVAGPLAAAAAGGAVPGGKLLHTVAAGREGPYHQRGEPAVVTIVTATTGKAELARCIDSIRQQDYRQPIQHLVLVDGPTFVVKVRKILAALQPPTSPSPAYASCPEAGHIKGR